jgi:hypothetical protein
MSHRPTGKRFNRFVPVSKKHVPTRGSVAATKLCIAEKLRKQKHGISRLLRSCSVIQPRKHSMKTFLSAIGIAAAVAFSASMLVTGGAEAATTQKVVVVKHHHVVHHRHHVVHHHHAVKHAVHHHHHKVVHHKVVHHKPLPKKA